MEFMILKKNVRYYPMRSMRFVTSARCSISNFGGLEKLLTHVGFRFAYLGAYSFPSVMPLCSLQLKCIAAFICLEKGKLKYAQFLKDIRGVSSNRQMTLLKSVYKRGGLQKASLSICSMLLMLSWFEVCANVM